jgi:hypothetical protein
MKKLIPFVAVFGFCAVAFAEDMAMDMTKMGPMTRLPKAMDTKGVDALYAACEEAHKKGDVNMAAEHMDFPLFMSTDDANGMYSSMTMDKATWVKEMTPWFTSMPKDMKVSMKHKISWHSDTLATVIEENTMTMGKTKGTWTSASMVVKKDGKWMFKSMTEAGWGKPMDKMVEKNTAAPAPAKTATSGTK